MYQKMISILFLIFVSGINSEKPVMKILAIGNSIAEDSYSYVPFMPVINKNVDLTIGIAYIGGASFQDHLDNFSSTKKYRYFKAKTGDKTWTSQTGFSLRAMLEDEKWTHITFQQRSGDSEDYSKHGQLKALLGKVKGVIKHEAKYGWLMIPVRPERYVLTSKKFSIDKLDLHYKKLMSVIKKVVEEYKLDFVFPCGTGIRNALDVPELAQLKDQNEELCNMDNNDKLHMRNGIPKLVEGYSIASKILEMIGVKELITNDNLEVHKTSSSVWRVPGSRHFGGPVDSKNRLLAQKCALMAIKNPYTKSKIE